MADIFHRRYEPYFNRGIEELKFSPERAKRKPLHSTKLRTNKLFIDGFTKKSLLTKKNPANIGKYILTDINPATCLCQAYHIESKKEYTCRVIEISKYREVVTPYFHIQSHEHINKIVEIILGEQFAYIFFETSYGDLHSYVRSKRRLKEEEASQFFQQIVEVVKYCHQNGLVLRDLKLRKFVFKDKARWGYLDLD